MPVIGVPRISAILQLALLCTAAALCTDARAATADPDADVPAEAAAARPAIGMYRWQEDWSVLADPARRTEAADGLKYIPLSEDEPQRYLSLGVTLRERYEHNDAPRFGTGGRKGTDAVLHRLELHFDAHLTESLRAFVQVENALAPGLKNAGAADANRLDLRLAFVDGRFDAAGGIVRWRIGRQEMAFDLQRFISVRDGPNVRQAYDAVWADYVRGPWRVSGFASQPVQYRNASAFDDFSDRRLAYGGLRVQRTGLAGGAVSATVSEYRNRDAAFPSASGRERRRNLDLRHAGAAHGFDWDIEGMRQGGRLGGRTVDAWAIGLLAGYTFASAPWKPRVAAQIDAASGDRARRDGRVGTFNPMFPNGYYLTLSGYTGYSNVVHFKPSLTLRPTQALKITAALGVLWRQTIHDAVYAQPYVALPRTAGMPGRRSADYAQLRADWSAARNLALAVEADRYRVAPVVRAAGGRDSTYLGVEMRWGW